MKSGNKIAALFLLAVASILTALTLAYIRECQISGTFAAKIVIGAWFFCTTGVYVLSIATGVAVFVRFRKQLLGSDSESKERRDDFLLASISASFLCALISGVLYFTIPSFSLSLNDFGVPACEVNRAD